MNKKALRIIIVVLIMATLALGLFSINPFSTVAASKNLEDSAIQFLSSFYEARSEAVVNSSKVSIFLNDYSRKSIKLRTHEANRINFYHNWIKQFNGTIREMHSNIYTIKGSFQMNNNKASIKVYEWITIIWTRKKENIDVNNLPTVKELEDLYKTTRDPLLKENLPYRIEELKKEIVNAPTSITSGIGVYHTVTLLRQNNSWKILKDNYNEGFDLTKSPDFVNVKKTNTQTTTPPLPSTVNSSYTNDHSILYYPQDTYDPDSALYYADQCVADYRPENVEFDYYNLNYVDFNNPADGDTLAGRESQLGVPLFKNYGGGGDCANFASQCLYAGGERMVKNSWYYDNNYTGITDPNDPNYWNLYWMFDDTSSTSWRYVPALKSFIIGHSRGTVITEDSKGTTTDNFSYAAKGDLVENGYHVMVIQSNDVKNKCIYVDAHNNDRKNFPISYSWLHQASYEPLEMYHLYPLVLNSGEDFFYPANFPIVRIADRRP